MKSRILVAVIGIPALLAVLLFCPPWAAAIFVSAVSVLGVFEMFRAAKLSQYLRLMIYSAVAALSVSMWCAFPSVTVWGLATVFFYFLALFSEFVAAKGEIRFHELCLAAFSALFIPFALSSLTRILQLQWGRFYIFIPLIIAFVSDAGAYFVGLRFGKHKLAPTVSPHKTIEGFIGGIVSCIVFMLIYAFILQGAFAKTVDFVSVVIFGLFGSLASTLGDLTFSVIKRQYGVKDYGTLLAEHGGVLDRFDSMIVVAPLCEILLILLPLIVK